MLSPNMITDFPFLCSLFVFLSFSCFEFLFLFCRCLWPFPVFAVKLRFSVATSILFVSLTIIDVSNKSSSWVVFCCTSSWLQNREQWNLSDVSWLFTLLHSTTTLSRSLIVVVRSELLRLYFFNCSPRKVISSCNFIKRSEFSAKTSLPQETKCLFLKGSTSAKNDGFRASNSLITESLNFHNSSLILILSDLLNCLWLFEYWVPFGKGNQFRVLTSFICTEWHFIDLSRSSLKCFFVISLFTDPYTKYRISSLPHLLLLHFRVSIEATMRVLKSLPSTICGTSSKSGISTE